MTTRKPKPAKPPVAIDESRSLNATQAADFLGVSRRCLVRELTKRPESRGGVPSFRIPGSNRFLFLMSDLVRVRVREAWRQASAS